MYRLYFFALLICMFCSCSIENRQIGNEEKYPNFSGIYPHLAYYNSQGECGTGAVVPWAGKLWVVTYSPHEPKGSDDKLYEISQELQMVIREESIGGTPANRMIHLESNQLFIGPYAIDNKGEVRAITYEKMPGRHTGNARHLGDPANRIYCGTMEEGFYDIEVQSLELQTMHKDGNVLRESGESQQLGPLLPGAHGKGLYSGQGVLVYANNGEYNQAAMRDFSVESGSLMEWDGREWRLIRRNQFCEVTGPGGIYGNANPETDPIWTTGFDHKSLLLGVRDNGSWSFFRLPKASHSYDGAHGWNTEWPRIRDVGTPREADYLMTMHGMFWKFPEAFEAGNTGGIRPRSAYLKVIGDFARWNNQLVFGCDDSAQREFLNKRKAKGGIEGPGQSNSNLWFTSLEKPDLLGPSHASGSIWLKEAVNANEFSEPFLFDGWEERSAWIHNHAKNSIVISLDVDKAGNGNWQNLKKVTVPAESAERIAFADHERGEWIRASINVNSVVSMVFSYAAKEKRSADPDDIFSGLTIVESDNSSGGLLYGLGDNRKAMGIAARDERGNATDYYELDSAMNLVQKYDSITQSFIEDRFAIPRDVISVEASSVLIVDDSGRRWRLPKGSQRFDLLINNAQTRICREVATERDLFNCHGTFYELPAENADGYAKIRPIASHEFRIHDYASYRGMLIMTGIDPDEGQENPHIVRSDDGKLAIWAGVIDDLWSLGKPIGQGGPLLNTPVVGGVPSDPYLIGFYDKRNMRLSHDNSENIQFRVEVNPTGQGPWMTYKTVSVNPNEVHNHEFPEDFEARWVRVIADKNCIATAWFVYN